MGRHVIVVVARLMKAFAASRAAEGEGAGVRLQMTPESIAASKRLGTKSARQRLAERRRRQRRRRMPRWRRSLLTKRRANRRRRRLVNRGEREDTRRVCRRRRRRRCCGRCVHAEPLVPILKVPPPLIAIGRGGGAAAVVVVVVSRDDLSDERLRVSETKAKTFLILARNGSSKGVREKEKI